MPQRAGEIVDFVRQVSDIVSGIATASVEQGEGIDQFNPMVTELDDATQQIAAQVEGAVAASENV